MTIKAYAYWKDGRRLKSHRDLWEYKDKVADELGGWVGRLFREASGFMHASMRVGVQEEMLRKLSQRLRSLRRKSKKLSTR